MRSISPKAYRRITLAAALLLAIIIVTGAAVRLTQSGLGCPQWPNCRPGRLTPRGASDYHAMVEFVNRTFTGLVSIAVIVAVLGSLLRRPRRRDLVWLSWSLVAGVLAQIVLGGITVLVDLHPLAVMSHFLLSILVLAGAIVLHHRAGQPDDGRARPAVDPAVVRLGRLLVVVAAVVVVSGTVVTNTGPHAGDANAKRFGLYLPSVARVHGVSVMCFCALVILTLFVASRSGALPRLQRSLTVLLVAVVAQAAIGYTQYFTGVPPLLVGFHIAGVVAVWGATVLVWLRCYERAAPGAMPADAAPDARAGAVLAAT